MSNAFSLLKNQPLKVSALIDLYLKHASKTLRPGTIEDYRYASMHLHQSFGDVEISSLQRTDMFRWHLEKSATIPQMADKCLAVMHGAYHFASNLGLLDPTQNPCLHIKRNLTNQRTRYLSEEEIRTLLQATYEVENERVRIAKKPKAAGIYGTYARSVLARSATMAIRMLIYTGCRKNEILTAKTSYLETLEGRPALYLPHTKTRPRIVALPNVAIRELKKFQTMRKSCAVLRTSEWLFPSPVDPTQHIHTPIRVWNRVREASGLEDVCLHDLRRTYASQAILAGCNFSDVAAQLGHESDQITRKFYANVVVPPGAKVVAEKVGQRMEKLIKKRS